MISDRTPLAGNLKLSYLYHLFLGIPVIEPYLQICWHPEGSGRFPEACPEAYASIRVLLHFRKVPEGFRKLVRKLVCLFSLFLQFRKTPEGFQKPAGSLFEDVIFLHSGRFRKAPGGATGSGIKYQVMVWGLVSDASWQLSMAFLNLHGVSEGRVSIACLLISPCGSCILYHA